MKESLIVTAIQQYLQLLENQGKLVYQRNNSGSTKIGNNFIRFGKTGSPDLYVFLPNGKTLMIEVKNDKGKLSEGQKEFQEKITNLGHEYIVVRSLDEVIKCLTK
jgi:VRR-NUC domain